MTPTQPMPTTVILELVEMFAIDLAREGVDVEAVVRAAHVLARTLARLRIGTSRARPRPSSNGHHAPAEGD